LTRLEELYGPLPMNKKDVKEEMERDEAPRYVQKRPLPQVPPPSSAKKAKSERLISFSEYGSGIYLKIINFLCPDRFQLKLQQINSLFTLQFPKKFDKYLKQSIDTTNHHSFQMF
jgi:hypothetical protein